MKENDKKSVMYQIALRTFTAGGTLKSAMEMFPYLRENGFDIIYVCACFKEDEDMDYTTWSPRQKASYCMNPKNPYKIEDYFTVDSEFGNLEDLQLFIQRAHDNSLKVLLDLVYLHCGRNAVFIKEHPDWVKQNFYGETLVGEGWPFARLNYENYELREYLWRNMEYYVKEFDVDGYRCDVGAQVPLDFWEEGKNRIMKINPDIIMLNEAWNEPDYVQNVFDMDYSRLVFELSSEKTKEELRKKKEEGTFGKYINYVENHDTASDSWPNRFDKKNKRTQADANLFYIYTREGMPFIWNGNEIADVAEVNMFSNRFFGKRNGIDWSGLVREEGRKRLQLIRELNQMRHEYDVLTFGDTEIISDDSQPVIAYIRDDGTTKMLAVIGLCENVEYETALFGGTENVVLSRNADLKDGKVVLAEFGFALILLSDKSRQ